MAITSTPPEVVFTKTGLSLMVQRFPELYRWTDDELMTLWRARFGMHAALKMHTDVCVPAEMVAGMMEAMLDEKAFDMCLTLVAFSRRLLLRHIQYELTTDWVIISFTINEGD